MPDIQLKIHKTYYKEENIMKLAQNYWRPFWPVTLVVGMTACNGHRHHHVQAPPCLTQSCLPTTPITTKMTISMRL